MMALLVALIINKEESSIYYKLNFVARRRVKTKGQFRIFIKKCCIELYLQIGFFVFGYFRNVSVRWTSLVIMHIVTAFTGYYTAAFLTRPSFLQAIIRL